MCAGQIKLLERERRHAERALAELRRITRAKFAAPAALASLETGVFPNP